MNSHLGRDDASDSDDDDDDDDDDDEDGDNDNERMPEPGTLEDEILRRLSLYHDEFGTSPPADEVRGWLKDLVHSDDDEDDDPEQEAFIQSE